MSEKRSSASQKIPNFFNMERLIAFQKMCRFIILLFTFEEGELNSIIYFSY